jgi:hypothetical protein
MNTTIHKARTLGFLCALAAIATAATGADIYVEDDAAVGGDGTTWDTPFKYLQDALDVASPGDIIKIAGGVYRPDESEAYPNGTGDREASFKPPEDSTLMGGFAGVDMPNSDLRNIDLYVTTLDGDLNEDDLPGFVNRSDNSRHIVYARNGLAAMNIHGCTIRGGYSEGDSTDPIISGGAGVLSGAYQQHIQDCRFVDNHTGRTGGALYTRHGNALVERTTFEGNAGGFGAGLNSFSGNIVIVDSCNFVDNHSDFHGGAIANEADLLVLSSFISCNTAVMGSGAISTAGNLTILSSTITQNHAPETGGIGVAWWTESATITNTVLWGNTNNSGGGQNAQISEQSGLLEINYSCVRGWTGGLGGTGNTGDDPAFVDELGPDGLWGSGDEDCRLSSGSACVDAGDNDVATGLAVDLDGCLRFVDHPGVVDTGQGDAPIVDIGAFEWQMTPCWHADLSADGQVDQSDLGIMLAWYQLGDGGDLDGDGDTDQADLGILLSEYGNTCY